jgi:AmmeMemoRadiSam system protein A
MAPGPSPEAQTLLDIARDAIERGVREGRTPEVDPFEHPQSLREPRAVFVTLRRGGALRGCTGTLEPQGPLISEVARVAHRTAFEDPRFTPLRSDELHDLDVHVSILGPTEPFPVGSEAELLAGLRPGVDGLVLVDGSFRATFLPAVWESLPDPEAFVSELKRKAGLAPDHWSATLRFERYRVEEIAELVSSS